VVRNNLWLSLNDFWEFLLEHLGDSGVKLHAAVF
jgi:hypothetical protein